MAAPDTCSTCGRPLAAGRCLRCENQSGYYQFVHREIVILLVLLGVTVAVFFSTRRFAASNQALRLDDGRTWYAQAQQSLQRGDLETGLAAMRRAVAKNPDDFSYRVALAHALIEAHQDETARQLLLELREDQPENPDTNLLLARIETRRGDRAAVGRYYDAAIIGLWEPAQRPVQRQVRTEFIEFLLSQGERDRALSELLVLEAELPSDSPSQIAVGKMLLAAGDARRASGHFERALRIDPDNQMALAAEGEASFQLGEYERADRYISRLEDSTDRTKNLRRMIDLVLAYDPLAPRLQVVERRRRLAAALLQVGHRLRACHGSSAQPLLAEIDRLAGPSGRTSLRNTDQIAAAFDVAFQAERTVETTCGSLEPLDRALLLIARRHGLEGQ